MDDSVRKAHGEVPAVSHSDRGLPKLPADSPALRAAGLAAASLTAGILVGGASRRMGRDKALLAHSRNRTLVEHTCAIARELTHDVVILGRAGEMPPGLEGARVLADERADAGPLGGLVALLKYVEQRCGSGGGWGLLLACDMPRLDARPLMRLWQSIDCGRSEAWDAAAFTTGVGERLETCAGFYHSRGLAAAQVDLDGARSIQNVLAGIRTRCVRADAAETVALVDVDTPAAYRAYIADP